jgi:glutathione peroxidase-family protein
MSSFFDFEMNDINGTSVPFERFRDQVSLVVNVASR